jgi:hypothetical protein
LNDPKLLKNVLNSVYFETFETKRDQSTKNFQNFRNPSSQHNGQLIITKIATYSPENGLQISAKSPQHSKLKIRQNLQQIEVKVMVVVNQRDKADKTPLGNYLLNDYDPWLDSLNRFNFGLLEEVRKMFNLR